MDSPIGSTREDDSRGRRAVVCLDGQRVGELSEIDEGHTRFVYDAEWLSRPDAVPVSLTLPLRAEPYNSKALHPFFENLLPEGWLLQLSTTKLKISPDDAFGLLLATCADCVGAVEIVPTTPGVVVTLDDHAAADAIVAADAEAR
ncbi:MAG: HipA N-terminal domain-containing protein [Acidobacteria bacterium]|nr:HipA N-terminal domain-containing protein [Acidobacteriota bacterium]